MLSGHIKLCENRNERLPSLHLLLQAALQDGMESMSQAKVGSALQVYFNLEELQQVGGCTVLLKPLSYIKLPVVSHTCANKIIKI